MPRTVNQIVEKNFINGLISEATALNFPEHSCVATDNCVFNIKGNVERRKGMNFESGHSTLAVSRTGKAIKDFMWQNPAGQPGKSILVVQMGSALYFYNITNGSVSPGLYASPVSFSGFASGDVALVAPNECEFAYGQGYLFVVHPYCKPFYVKYDPVADSFSATGIDINIRDTEGILDELGYVYDQRPTTLTDLHKYNLYNQGWKPTNTNDYITSWRTASTTILPISVAPWFIVITTAAARTDYPSNADVWWLLRDSADNFNVGLADKRTRGNTPAPKGHYLLDAFNQDRSTVSGIPGITVVSSGVNRPRTVAFFAGRVFYSGVTASNFGNNIYFSQIIENTDQFGRCYQLNDPTNENLFDILATDGGVLKIPDCGQIVKMFSIQNSLLVFATNGVWSITGNQGIGFTATDFTVRKVSSIPATSPNSFVDVEGLPTWWNNDGIYSVSEINAAGLVRIDPLVEKTIKTFYINSIPVANKNFVRGSFNPVTRQIVWLYRVASISNNDQRQVFDRALIYNVLTKAFYTWSFPHTTIQIHGVQRVSTDNTSATFKFLCSTPTSSRSFTFAEEADTRYRDFYTFDNTGVDYVSTFTTGYRVDGDGDKKFQNNYVTVLVKNIADTQFYFQGIFNFGNVENPGDFQANQLIQFAGLTRDYDYRRIKVRGTGKAVQFKVTSVTGKPFDISGWSVFVTANRVP